MIALTAALLLQQIQPDPPGVPPRTYADLPAYVEGQMAECPSAQAFLAGPGAANTLSIATRGRIADGAEARTTFTRGQCSVVAPAWSPSGERMAEAVRAGLARWTPGFTVTAWRDREASEHGLTMWTTFEQRDATGTLTGVVQLIEPADGATGEVSVTYQRP